MTSDLTTAAADIAEAEYLIRKTKASPFTLIAVLLGVVGKGDLYIGKHGRPMWLAKSRFSRYDKDYELAGLVARGVTLKDPVHINCYVAIDNLPTARKKRDQT